MIPSPALVVAAHPGDDVLGCGGTLARFRGAIAGIERAEAFQTLFQCW